MKFRDDTDRRVLAYLLATNHWHPGKYGNLHLAKTILDVGAHGGYSTWLYRNAYPDAHVYAVEPDRQNFAVLKANVRGLDVACLNAALWHEQDWVLPEGSATNTLTMAPSRDERAVPAMTLSQIMKRLRLDTIDFLKVDIEGSEREVLWSAVDSLAERAAWMGVKCALVDRHSIPAESLANVLVKLGFTVDATGDHQMLARR